MHTNGISIKDALSLGGVGTSQHTAKMLPETIGNAAMPSGIIMKKMHDTEQLL